MAMYDWNGTNDTELGKAYDWNGTTSAQLSKGYDWNGTTNSLIYNAELLLYNYGDLCTADSGGWTSVISGSSNIWTTKESDHLKIVFGKSEKNHAAAWITTNKIDLTGYSKLRVRVIAETNKSHNFLQIGIATAYSTSDVYNQSWTASTGCSGTTYDGTLELDISSYNSSYYIILRPIKYTINGETSLTAKFYKVWLE